MPESWVVIAKTNFWPAIARRPRAKPDVGNAMKYGMNLLLWTDTLDDSHLPVLDKLKAIGYDGVELPMFSLDTDYYAKWGKRLDDLGLERTAVTIRGAEDN